MTMDNHAARKAAVYEAALQLVARGVSPAAMTIQQLADTAGIGKGTVYGYFSSKEEILQGLAEYCFARENERIRVLFADCCTLAGLEERTVSVLQAFLQEAPVTIRTNLLKITPEALEMRLKEEGVTTEKIVCADMPELNYAFMISGFDHLNALESFREGLFYVQDVSSMMVAETVDPVKDSYIMDVCAAPGGKSVHLAEKLGGTGMVEARDLTDYKTDLIRQNIARHQLSNMRAVQMDATVLDEASIGKADVVIADLPCSGLGVMRRKTDIKYKMTLQTEQELVSLQRKMLETVCQYVKAGGTLLYSTCTMDKMENEDNVTWFLKQHPQFELVKMQQIFPQKTYGDGFFLAKLQKKA